MLFETLTIASVMIAKTLIAWKAAKTVTSIAADSEQMQESSEETSQQDDDTHTDSLLLDEHQTERRNEIFVQIYLLLTEPEKSQIQQLTTAFQKLASIYSISSKHDSEEMAKLVLEDFNEYVSPLKNSKTIADRFGALHLLLEYAFRRPEKAGILKYYYLDIGKDRFYAKTVLENIENCFNIILHDELSNSKYEIKTHDIKNYSCLLGAAGKVYDDFKKVLHDSELFDTRDRLSYELLYEIAEYIHDTTHFYFCKGITTGRLAKDITDSIIHYIHNDVDIKEEFSKKYGDNPERYVDKVIERFLLNRDIESYPYFLKMACKVLEALGYQNMPKDISCEDAKRRIEIAKKKLPKLDLPILTNHKNDEIKENHDEIWKDIKKAFENKDIKLPKETKK